MEAVDATGLPVPEEGIGDGIPAGSEMLAASHGQFINVVGGEDVGGVEVRRSPFCAGIV